MAKERDWWDAELKRKPAVQELSGRQKFWTGPNSSGGRGSALPRAVRKNTVADRRGRNAAHREAVEYAVPTSIQWVLSNRKRVSHRFTPYEWAILNARYGRHNFVWYKRSSVAVGRQLGMTGKSQQVRDDERAAHRTAYELYYGWEPAVARWKRGLPLTADQRQLLAKHKHAKKGRRGVHGFGPPDLPADDVMDRWRDADGKSHGRTTNFSDLYPSTRRQLGVGEEYGEAHDE
jgi:hypothetical protein